VRARSVDTQWLSERAFSLVNVSGRVAEPGPSSVGTEPASPARRRLLGDRRILLAAGALSIGIGLAVRVVHRGPYVPGWDFLGAAEGLWLVSTKTAAEIVSLYIAEFYNWHLTVWNLWGAPVVLLPGAL